MTSAKKIPKFNPHWPYPQPFNIGQTPLPPPSLGPP